MSKTLRGVLKRQPQPVPDTSPPTTPTSLTATIVGNQVSLAWTSGVDNVAVTASKIWRSTVSGVFTTPLTITSALSAYTDTTAAPSTLYYYTVSQIDGASPPNESAKATQASVTTPSLSDVTAPNIPAQPAAATVDNTTNPPTYTTTLATVADINPGGGSPVSGMVGGGKYRFFHDGVFVGERLHPSGVGATVTAIIGINSGGSILTGSDSAGTMSATSSTGDVNATHWGTQDEYLYSYEPVSGAGRRFFRITGLTGTPTYKKFGLEFRSDLSAGAANCTLIYFGAVGLKGEQRPSTGAQSTGGSIIADPGTSNLWVAFDWLDNWTVTRSYSTNSTNGTDGAWTTYDTISMPFGSVAYVGRMLDCNTYGNAGATVSGTYSNYGGSGASSIAWSAAGVAGTTKNLTASAVDVAGNESAQGTARPITFSAQGAPSAQYYPALSGFPIGGSPRNYGAAVARLAKYRFAHMGIWPSWQGAGQSSLDMPSTINAIKALNPNTQCFLYTEWMRLLPNSVYASLKATLDAHNGWLRTSYPAGAVVSWDGGTYPDPAHTYTANLTDATAQADIANFHVDFLNNGDAGGYNTVHPNSVDSVADGWVFDDQHWNMNYLPGALDVNKDGSADARNSTLDQAWRNGQTAIVNLFKAKKPAAKIWINLSVTDVSNYAGFRTDFAGRLLEAMVGETWSPETWGQFTDLLTWYDQHSTLLAVDGAGIFGHRFVGANGTDPYDATPYRASCFGLCTSLLGNTAGWTADYWPSSSDSYDINQDNRWFDEFAVDSTGHGLTQAQESANNGRGYLGNPSGVRTKIARGTFGVYMRTFANGWVFVNPKNNGSQVAQPSDVGGTSVAKFIIGTQDTTRNSGANFTSNFTMPARSGLILLKRSAFGG